MIEEIPWQSSVSTAEVSGSILGWDPCMWEAQPKNTYDIKNENILDNMPSRGQGRESWLCAETQEETLLKLKAQAWAGH